MTTSSGIKRSWQRVDGVLLLDKPGGLSSNTALQRARRVFSAAKAGHTGTLDPMATGLLPICFGEATKFSADLLDADKTYEADLLFGVKTDTADADGEVVLRRPVDFLRGDLDAAVLRFLGPIRQVPPMYSAIKRDGQPLYKLARQGIEVERAAREITIHRLDVLEHDGDRVRLSVRCSKGTYIRTLAEDIGEVLGCGAHLTALRRTAVGDLSVADAVPLERLQELSEESRAHCLLPPDALVQTLPMVHLETEAMSRFMHGNPVRLDDSAARHGLLGKCRVYGENRLLGLAEIDAEGWVHPRRLMVD